MLTLHLEGKVCLGGSNDTMQQVVDQKRCCPESRMVGLFGPRSSRLLLQELSTPSRRQVTADVGKHDR